MGHCQKIDEEIQWRNAAYKRYRGLSNGVYYKKITGCADGLSADPDSMQPLPDMAK
ncbi:hypothetical protein OKW30_006327 [Paraburkholderia sp. Clong3]